MSRIERFERTYVFGETTVLLYYNANEGWEVYYKRKNFPFMFAFGLPVTYVWIEVANMARENIENYADMFDDEVEDRITREVVKDDDHG